MSLLYITGTGKRVDHGTNVGTFTACTWCGWVYVPTLGNVRTLFSKSSDSDLAGAPNVFTAATDEMRVTWRGATNMSYETSNLNLTAGRWWFLAMTIDIAAGTGAKAAVYAGDLNTPATAKTMTATTEGATPRTNASTMFRTGNGPDLGDESPWVGCIASTFFWPGVILSPGQIGMHRLSLVPLVAGCKVSTIYDGTGTQWDRSGYNNHGTVTELRPSMLHPPFLRPRSLRRKWFDVGAASAAARLLSPIHVRQAGHRASYF